jgi:ankyrin repeat protein
MCRQEIVHILLSAGANVHAQGLLKQTPLYEAISLHRDPDECGRVVKTLIEAGADVNAVQELTGNTPLIKALDSCSYAETLRVVVDLLDAGANPLIKNQRGENAVTRSSTCGNQEVFRLISRQARLFLGN